MQQQSAQQPVGKHSEFANHPSPRQRLEFQEERVLERTTVFHFNFGNMNQLRGSKRKLTKKRQNVRVLNYN